MFHMYGLMIGIGLIVGIWMANIHARRFLIKSPLIEDALLWIAVPAIIGARLYHVITDWHLYSQASLLQFMAVWNGGLGYFGALIGGIVGIIIFITKNPNTKYQISNKNEKFKIQNSNRKTFIFFLLLDLLAFGAPVAQAIGRFGNYFNQELYGLPTNVSWGIVINGQRHHPLFAYEAIGNMFIFLFVNWLGWKQKFPIGKGQYACVYIALYALLRFWLEFLRMESARMSGFLGVFSIAQWVSVSLAIVAVGLFWLRRHANRGIEWELKTLL